MIATLRAGSEVFHGDRSAAWRLREGPVWAVSTHEGALDYGPFVYRMVIVRDARLLVFGEYEEAAKQLGVRIRKAASRDLVDGVRQLGVDGYWYQNPLFSTQEVMLLDGRRFLGPPQITRR